jgi:tRNA A37 threonylcarbamoyladenosine dehydratase
VETGPESYGNKRRSVPASSPFVPPAAGLILASAVVRDLLKKAK